MLTDPFKDGRKDRLEDFRYGPKESPNYIEYVPEVYSLLDTYFQTPRGSPDALRLVKLIRQKMENGLQTDTEVLEQTPLYDHHRHPHPYESTDLLSGRFARSTPRSP